MANMEVAVCLLSQPPHLTDSPPPFLPSTAQQAKHANPLHLTLGQTSFINQLQHDWPLPSRSPSVPRQWKYFSLMHFILASFSKMLFQFKPVGFLWKHLSPFLWSWPQLSFGLLFLCAPASYTVVWPTSSGLPGLTWPDRVTLFFHGTWLPLKALELLYLILIIGNVV